jgi:hypothetical protein
LINDKLRDFELETVGESSTKSIVKESNAILRQLKQTYTEKENELHRVAENHLMGEDGDDGDENDEEVMNTKRQTKLLREGRKEMSRAKDYASNTSGELRRQNEVLERSLNTVREHKEDNRDLWRPGYFFIACWLTGITQAEEQAHLLLGLCRVRATLLLPGHPTFHLNYNFPAFLIKK